MSSGIRLNQLDILPAKSRHNPKDTLYVQLGCSSCVNMVIFSATSQKVGNLYPIAAFEQNIFLDTINQTGVVQKVWGNKEDEQIEPCEEQPCPNSARIQSVVDRLNQLFEASLVIGQPTK